jgi:DNA-directed RNA polymerase specialized sigma54-like protein
MDVEKSQESPETVDPMVVEEEDEMELAFEAIENTIPQVAVTKDYLKLVKNPRTDDIANRVKEKCIYK